MSIHFSSASDQWTTPQWLFDRLHKEFGFKIDVCATRNDAKLPLYFSPAEDGLSCDWAQHGCCWMNPPYGRQVGSWVRKAWNEAGRGATVVCLLPSRTDTNWWAIFWNHNTHRVRNDSLYEDGRKGDEVRFLKGRLKFGNAETGAPFPSAVVIMRPRYTLRDGDEI